MKQQRGCRSGTSQRNIYIKISEAEIANNDPLPAFYEPSVEEMDEYIYFGGNNYMSYPDLPRRVLNNWALYNSDSRIISLELILMKPCMEIDVTAIGSGNMRIDDGGGFYLEADPGTGWESQQSSMLHDVIKRVSEFKKGHPAIFKSGIG
ncbi:putative DNA (cytosine-5)-methyltransferase 2 [Cocos nucifera]|uniref:Putative DNA (Cytosine-5)-methyltransferase 2 n=1 Tax=Cocos nucifera TaxID=13894 RepID=A0A8K0IXL1_COCNU|nr:putative DNA (cytosine-5)-methyltransferase 2 [Cocos nucifera]